MARIGVFCLPMRSHINLFVALATELSSRGHHLTFFNLPQNEDVIRGAGFKFESVEPDTLPAGTLKKMMHDMGGLGSLAALRLQGRFDEIRYKAILGQGLSLVRKVGLQAMIVDQAEPCSGSLADAAALPWVTVSNGLCLNSEPRVPPFVTSWAYSENPVAVLRNRLLYKSMQFATSRTEALINHHRKGWGLKAYRRFDDSFSPFAQICQQNREFDFPRRELPSSFHYVGPIFAKATSSIDFPWKLLDGRPLIYASLGTVVNRHKDLLRTIAMSCEGLNVQLVVTLGGNREEDYQDLSGSALVVRYAPQRELLARAALTVTHGGLNTTLESLAHGVPIVAIPLAFEQPGIAARIRWTGTGEFLPRSEVNCSRLRSCITKVLSELSYKRAAEAMAAKIRVTIGRELAADIVEAVINHGKLQAKSATA